MFNLGNLCCLLVFILFILTAQPYPDYPVNCVVCRCVFCFCVCPVYRVDPFFSTNRIDAVLGIISIKEWPFVRSNLQENALNRVLAKKNPIFFLP
jgi:hypothetical protein